MNTVDLAFPLLGDQPIAADHGYHLYAALSRLLPALHQSNGVAVHPIRGIQIGDRRMSLNDRSRLILRLEAARLAELLDLAGKQLDIGGSKVRVGVPQVWSLRPAAAVRARLVTTKNAEDQPRFERELTRQLAELGISDAVRTEIESRRTLRIKNKEIVGYRVLLEGLSAEESLTIQENGLGGRRHMGCGVFVAVAEGEAKQ